MPPSDPVARQFVIGCGTGGEQREAWHFRGQVDEFRVSRTVRYTDERFEPETRFEPDEMTIALYHFDEGEGDVLRDSSGNGHHGKIVGAKWVRADVGASSPINRLPLVELDRLQGGGPAWRLEPNGLVTAAATFARTTVDVDVPEEYEVHAVVEPLEGNSAPLFGLTSAGRRFWVAVNGNIRGEWRSTIEPLPTGGAGTADTPGTVLATGRVSKIVLTVRRDHVTCVCDGKTVVDWRGDLSTLEEWENWTLPDPKKLAIGAWKSRLRLHRLDLRPLPPELNPQSALELDGNDDSSPSN